MNEKNYFRNRIASEDNMKLFETTTHIEWDWRIETLAHIAVRLGMCFDIETDAVYLFTPIPEQQYYEERKKEFNAKGNKQLELGSGMYYAPGILAISSFGDFI